MEDLNLISDFFENSSDFNSGFRLETHLHTSEASKCSNLSPADAVRMYKKAGYDGIIVTDHFLTGNTSVDKTLPWETQVDLFFKGYENALEEGKKVGLRVFEGLEYSDFGTDFIVLGLSREFIKNNPQMVQMTPEEFLPFFRAAGAFVIQAHPFREASYIREVRSYAEYVDAIEVINIGNRNSLFDDKAYELASKYNKLMTAGSDCHHFGNEFFGAGILMNREPKDVNDLIGMLADGNCYSYFSRGVDFDSHKDKTVDP